MLIESSLRRKGVVECCLKAVMKMYKEVLSQVKVEGEDSKEFAVRVDIHQGSVLLPFIFAVVMDVVTEKVAKEGCALMYVDDMSELYMEDKNVFDSSKVLAMLDKSGQPHNRLRQVSQNI